MLDCARLDPSLVAPDSLQLGLLSLLHSLAHPDMVLLVLDPVVLGPTSSAQNGIEGFDAGEFTGTQLSLSGFLRVGGMLVVLDSTRLDFPPAAPDLLHLELLLLLHSLARDGICFISAGPRYIGTDLAGKERFARRDKLRQPCWYKSLCEQSLMSWSFSAGICLCKSWCPLVRKVCVPTWLRINLPQILSSLECCFCHRALHGQSHQL